MTKQHVLGGRRRPRGPILQKDPTTKKLIEFIDSSGLDDQWIAKRAGIPKNRISVWRSGGQAATARSMSWVLEAMGAEIEIIDRRGKYAKAEWDAVKPKKLTKAQRELLRDCASDERGMTGVVQNYAPAKILVANGLGKWLHDDPYSERLIITDAGRKAIGATNDQ